MSTQTTHPMHTPEGWDATAEDYDTVNIKDVNFTPKYCSDLFHYALTGKVNSDDKEVVESIHSLSSAKIIDIASGTGGLTIPAGKLIAKSNNPNAKILGTDFSPKMVALQENKVKEENLQNFIDCKVMDGQALDLSDNSFDFAFSVFGLILFPQPLKGLSEIYRVLVNGGMVGIATWTTNHTIMQIHNEALQKVLSPTSRPAPAFGTMEEITEALKGCGFQDIRIVKVTHSAEFGSAEKYFRMMQNNPGLGLIKQKLGEECWSLYKQEIERLFQTRYPSYSLPCEALLAVARK